VRRQERVNVWRAIADAEGHAVNGETPVVAFRRSRSGWYVALPLDRLLTLLQGRGAP
jgi:hypothetical protein